jgi:hypothetical protein
MQNKKEELVKVRSRRITPNTVTVISQMIEFGVNKQALTLHLITSKERQLGLWCLLQSNITEKNEMQSFKLVEIHGTEQVRKRNID